MISKETFKQGFPIKELSEVSEFLDSRRRPITASKRVPGPYPYYGANGQQDSVADYIFDEPLILLAEDGGLFDQPDRGIAYAIEGKTWVNNHAHVLRPRDNIYPKYLLRVLENYDVTPWITGSTRAKLTKAGASKIQIPLPPLAEQKRIAAILDAADAMRTKRSEAIALLDTLLQSTFLEMFGDPVTNPMGWDTIRLGDYTTKVGSGATPKGGNDSYKAEGIALIRSLNVRDGEFRWNDLARIDDAQARKLANVIVEENDVLLNITGASVARVCRALKDVLPARVNQHVCIIRTTSSLEPHFLERLLLAGSMKKKLLEIGESGATRQAITKAQVITLAIPLPSLELQKHFSVIVESIEHQKALHRAHLAELDTLFASLQKRAFNGELSK